MVLLDMLASSLMDLRQLEYLVAVAEEANFTRAAERLHVGQPGVSAQVRRLEAELGEALLDRSGGTVRPTDAGRGRPAARPRGARRRGRGPRHGAGAHRPARRPRRRGHRQRGHGAAPARPPRRLPARAPGRPGHAHRGAGRAARRRRRWPATSTSRCSRPSSRCRPRWPRTVVAEEALVAAVAPGPPARAAHDDHARRAGRARPDRPAARRRASAPASTPPSPAPACARRSRWRRTTRRCWPSSPRAGSGVAVVPESITRARPETLHALALRPALTGRVELAWRAAGPWSPAARALIDDARAILPA